MSENQKLREVLQLIAWSNDSKWQADCARQALAMPTAEQVDDINVAESFTSVTKTAAPVGERERFEARWRTVQMRTFPKDYDIERLQDWGSIYKPKALDAWQARAALSDWHLVEFLNQIPDSEIRRAMNLFLKGRP